ncbi:MAG: restriction endonuclease subunit S [Candidatus Eremiobacterota bacterium]
MIDMDNLPALPAGWVWTYINTIGENENYAIVDGPFGSHLKTSDYTDAGNIPVVSITNIDEGFSYDKLRFITKEKFEQIKRSAIKPGDILIAKIGSSYGKCGYYPNWMPVGVIPANLLKITVGKSFNKSFVFYYFKSWIFKEKLNKITKSTAQPAFNVTTFKELPIPIPPLQEQHRIVTKIEELFTKLDAGVDALKKVKSQLKRYRQSVLKHAFCGKLTEEWRKSHKDELEPASVLLERIREEKEKNGKSKKDTCDVNTEGLQELPEGWGWVRVKEISELMQYGTSDKSGDDIDGIPVIRMGNIREGKLVFENLKYFPEEYSQLSTFLLQDGDVLFNRTNSAELVGKTAVYKDYHPKSIFASYLIRVRVVKNLYNSDLLSFFINSFYGRKYIASVVSQQVGQANVNGTKLSLMPIPLPSIQEQHLIVEEIELRFSIAEEVEKTVDHSLKQAEKLRQSILKSAFSGRLVPQEPSDEPAEELLKKIKEEKEKTMPGENSKKRKPVKKSSL